MLHPTPSDALLADLYADAVLPSLADLLVLDPQAAQIAGQEPWSVALEVPGRTPVFLGNAVQESSGAAFPPKMLRLRFFSARHFARTCAGKRDWPPFPTGGWFQLLRAVKLTALTGRLNEVMGNSNESGELRAQLLFGGLLVRALAVLCQGQKDAAALLDRFDKTTFAFAIGSEYVSWFMADPSQGYYEGFGGAPLEPTALVIEFETLRIAAEAAEGRLDQLAAIGLGQVKVRGLTPLGDVLDVLLDRVDQYLR